MQKGSVSSGKRSLLSWSLGVPHDIREVEGGHIAESSIVNYSCRRSILPVELTDLVLIGQKVRSKEREVMKDCSQINIPGLQPEVMFINPAFALM